jgi:hypothetical protein
MALKRAPSPRDPIQLGNLMVDIATACLAGKLRPLPAAVRLSGLVNPWHSAWIATGGAKGPLAALYEAADEADRVGYIGDDAEWWHPTVRCEKAAELQAADAQMAARVHGACRAILEHARTTADPA